MDEPAKDNLHTRPATGHRTWSKTFHAAWSGLAYLFHTQRNARFHFGAAAVVVIAAVAFYLKPLEWVALILSIAAVLSAEAINTALECLADAIHPGNHPLIKAAKDCAAGAVLVAAMAAFAIGLLIFGPKLLILVRR